MSIEQILNQEYNYDFDEIRKKQMAMSYYKYGSAKENYKTLKTINAVESLELRLQKYKETGNTEFLADVANFAMLEFTYPQHEKAFYKATDSGECKISGMGINEIKEYEE